MSGAVSFSSFVLACLLVKKFFSSPFHGPNTAHRKEFAWEFVFHFSSQSDEKKEKKPLNGYQLYMKEKYPILLEKAKEKGEVNSKEIMIQIGRLWKEKKEGKEEEVVEVKENPKKDAKEKKVKAKK